MSIIVICIVIGLFNIMSSEAICVYGSSTSDYIEGILGNYLSGTNWNGLNGIWSYYYKMSVAPSCNIGSDHVYIRWRKTGDTRWRWEISWNLNANDYWYYKISYVSPYGSNLRLTNWYDKNGQIVPDLTAFKGQCEPSETAPVLVVTGYSGTYQGCNGEFWYVDGNKNLYKRTEGYDYGWTNEFGQPDLAIHYWLYSIAEQRWVCDMRDWEDPSMNDYAKGCYHWDISDGAELDFRADPPIDFRDDQ